MSGIPRWHITLTGEYMATIDQQFVEYIVKTLVNNPDKVDVERDIDERGVLLSLSVDPEDVGRVIGKRGATAQSIRTLLRVLGTKNGARYNLKVVNTDEGETAPEGRSNAPKNDLADQDVAETRVDIEAEAAEEALDKESDEADDLAAKTRAELADLDDLDV